MILSDAPVRPTRLRLLVANVIATGLVAALLGLAGLVASRFVVDAGRIDSGRLQVAIVQPTDVRPAPTGDEDAAGQPASRQEPPGRAVAEPLPSRTSASAPVTTDHRQAPDLQRIAADAVRSVISDVDRDESLRAGMWRQSGSLMFRPSGQPVADVDEPVLEDFRFRPKVHVAGLGVTIGSCFIGVPLVGVPVEDRTVAITLFVCARDSG